MKSAVETLSPTRAKLTVEVPFEELQPILDAAYRDIARQINVPGFRRGKVPPVIIDRQIGRGAVLDQALGDVVPAKYIEAIEANELQPLARPEIEVTRFEDGETLEFTAEVDVRPQVELPDYVGLAAQVDEFGVTDDDVTVQIDALRERFGTLADVERPAADGDFVTINLAGTKDGEPIPGAETSGMSYQVGRGGMIDGLDEVLVGMSAGDESEFTTQMPGSAGQEMTFAVTVTGVQEQELPEFDDDFAQLASEFDTAEELAADVRERLGRGKRLEQAAAARDAVLEVLLGQVEIPIPDSMVTEELHNRREQIEQELSFSGVTVADLVAEQGQTIEEFEAEQERRVRDAIAAQFLLDEVAKHEAFGVDQAELTSHLVRRAQQAGQNPQEFADHMVQHNHLPELVQEILRGKALAKIVESAVVTDSAGNHVELALLRPDGTIGEPEPEGAAETEHEPAATDESTGSDTD